MHHVLKSTVEAELEEQMEAARAQQGRLAARTGEHHVQSEAVTEVKTPIDVVGEMVKKFRTSGRRGAVECSAMNVTRQCWCISKEELATATGKRGGASLGRKWPLRFWLMWKRNG